MPVGGCGHGDALDGFFGEFGGFRRDHAVQQEERVDELVAGESFGKGVELRAVAHFAEEFFGVVGRDAEHADLAVRGPDQTGHQVHERGLAGAVGADQAGDAGRNGQVHAVDAQHFAVEAGDIVEDNAGLAHRTTSAPRILRASR